MSKTYLPYEPDQQLLLPAALQEWLPDDHLAYFISDVVDQLDMSEVTARYERERRGGPPYHPRMMVKVLLYGYCVGVASSRRIAQRLHEDIAFRVLAANNTPDFRTISDFRKGNYQGCYPFPLRPHRLGRPLHRPDQGLDDGLERPVNWGNNLLRASYRPFLLLIHGLNTLLHFC